MESIKINGRPGPTVIRGIKAVFFDMGNTLALLDYGVIKDLIAADLADPPSNRDVALAEYRARDVINGILLGRRDTTDQARTFIYYATMLKQLGVPPDRIKPLATEIIRRDRETGIWRVVLPGTYATLKQLKDRGFRLGIISNADGRVADLVVRTGLTGYFEVVLDSYVVGAEKPDPRIFRLGLQQLQVTAGESVFVGDIYAIDVVGARRAGLTPILMDPLLQYKGVDCLTIADLNELLTLVRP